MTESDVTLLGIDQDFLDTPDGVVRKDTQYFPDNFWEGMKWAREQQEKSRRLKNFHKVAEIPVIFVHKWLKEGFDIYKEPLKAIVAKLHAEDLTDFLATERRV